MPVTDPASLPVPPDGDQHLGKTINIWTLWTNILVLIAVAARLITRLCIVKARLWWDDYFIILAMLGTVIGGSVDTREVHFGFGRHQHYLTRYEVKEFTAYAYGECESC